MATKAMARLLPNVWLAHERMLRMNLTAASPLFATSTLRARHAAARVCGGGACDGMEVLGREAWTTS